jgi:putative tryptophan/tyrosine transport system substrate-binding protein
MKRRAFLALAVAGFAAPLSLRAQSPGVPRVGVLLFTTLASDPNYGALRAGLRDLGYAEGRNVSFIERFADGKPDRLRELASELVASKPDVIIALGGDVAPYVRAATAAIPVVVIVSNDPVQSGLVASLARPGGNVTGVTLAASDLAGKRLQMLKEIAPQISRLGVVWNPDHVDPEYREMQMVGQRLGVRVVSLEVRGPGDFEAAFGAAVESGVEAIVPVSSRLILAGAPRVLKFAAERVIPVASGWGPWARDGALFAYGPDINVATRAAAGHVQKILKGAKPAELPIELPTRFELVINLRSANALRLAIPNDLLVRADRIIE